MRPAQLKSCAVEVGATFERGVVSSPAERAKQSEKRVKPVLPNKDRGSTQPIIYTEYGLSQMETGPAREIP